MNKPILIVKTGQTDTEISTTYGDFEDWFKASINESSPHTKHCYKTITVYLNESLPEPKSYSGIIITGSPAMVNDQDIWIKTTMEWLHTCANQQVPIFGVCFGHQLIAKAFNGKVTNNPNGRIIGTKNISLTQNAHEDILFSGLPKTFHIQKTHLQYVAKPPSNAIILASSQDDPFSALSIGKTIWSVQFHPEFNTSIMKAYINARNKALIAENINPRKQLSNVKPSPYAKKILLNFINQLRN